MLVNLAPSPKEDRARLEKRLAEIDAYLARLQKEREEAKQALERLRLRDTICPRCGRDRDFLADEGGYLAHVLEDPQDTELLTPGKPLFCPACGDVFLYQGTVSSEPAPKRRHKPPQKG